MNRVRNGILILVGLCFWSVTLFAQAPGNQNTSPDEQEEAAKYERYYETVLDRSLREYYPRGTYLVDVKATVNRVMVAKGYDVVEPPPGLEIENLPGLPVIPPNLLNNERGRDSIKVSGFDSRYKLSGLNVKVIVDTSYSAEDLEFIEEAAAMITNADLTRGDVVDVSEKVFPGIDRPKPEPVEESEPEVIYAEPEPNWFLGINWNDPKQLLYVIAGLGLLFLLLLLILAFRRKPKEDEDAQLGSFPAHMYPQLMEKEDKEEPIEDEVREVSSDKQQQFERDRMYITNASVSNPKMIAEIISDWIDEDEDEGIVRAVRSIYSVDHKLMDVLEDYLKDEHYNSIQFGLSNIDTIPIKEKAEEVERFKKSIQGIKKERKQDDSENNLFDFLNQLTNQQLFHLVKGESDEMTAILLAQVAGERSSYVLQKMKEQKRVSVVLKMGKINNIPISIYKKVAAHFSSKALSVSDMKFVAADGVDSILATIDNLPVGEQDDFVSSIAKQDLDLAKKIRKYFVAFDDLPKMDDEVLQTSLENLETDQIIPALYQADEAIVEKVLSIRPKREQQLIRAELGNVRDLSATDVEKARKVLLREIRQHLKSSKA